MQKKNIFQLKKKKYIYTDIYGHEEKIILSLGIQPSTCFLGLELVFEIVDLLIEGCSSKDIQQWYGLQ